jgi:hypothetical protein
VAYRSTLGRTAIATSTQIKNQEKKNRKGQLQSTTKETNDERQKNQISNSAAGLFAAIIKELVGFANAAPKLQILVPIMTHRVGSAFKSSSFHRYA